MPLKDELDEKVRKERLTAKPKSIHEEINRKAQEDAEFLWKKLKKIFLKKTKHYNMAVLELGFVSNPGALSPAKVYFHMRFPRYTLCHLLTFRKIKYPIETREFLEKIAMQHEKVYTLGLCQRCSRATLFTDLWGYWTQYTYKTI